MQIINLYNKLQSYPFGNWLFSKLVCRKAPYFSSIHPTVYDLAPGRCVVTMDKRKAHLNNIGTVHAIAMCNMAELAAGLAMDVSVAEDQRWIPKGMRVQYLKKATTHLKASCTFDPSQISEGDFNVEVIVMDTLGNEVFMAEITMYISLKTYKEIEV